MSDTIPQNEALRLQLAAIAGNEPVRSSIEMRWRRPDGPMISEFLPAHATKSIGERVRALAERGDTFVSACPRVRRRGTKSAIERAWLLWVDLDQADSIERLEAFTPKPSIVLMTGTPGHALALWPLNVPLEARHIPQACKRLAHALGGDLAATDAARIIRLPQTQNFKTEPPEPVECVRLELDVFEARDVVGELPDPPPKRAPVRKPRAIDLAGDALAAIPATEYAPALLGRELGRDGKVTCPWHAGGQERTPSLHAYPDASAGWYCWGCDRGGTIIDFGSLLYAIEPRGRGYHAIRERLARDLVAGIEAAA